MTLSRMFGMMVGLVGIRVGGAVLNLLSQILFARLFLPQEVGVIFLGMSTAAFFGLVATVGYPWLALTQLPRFATLGHQKIIRAFHAAFLHDGAIAYVVICAVALAVSYLWPQTTAVHLALLFGCLAAPASMLMRYDSAVANSQRKFSLSYMPDFLLRPVLLLGYVLTLERAGFHLSVVHALLAFVVCLHLSNIIQAVLLGRDGALLSDLKYANSKLTAALRPRAMSLAIVAAVATSFADIVTMVAGLLLSSNELASVAVAVRLAAMAGFVIQVAQQLILPDLTAALTKRDHTQAQNLLLRLNLMTIATIAAALLGALLFGHWALAIFGKAYISGWPLLIALMIGQSIRAFSGMNQQLLSIAGYQARTASACLVAVVFLIAGAIFGVRIFGIQGIGYAVIVAELVWSIMLAAHAQILTGRRGDIFWVLKHNSKTKSL